MPKIETKKKKQKRKRERLKVIFDKEKTYTLQIQREGPLLCFTATNVEIVGALISFRDRYGQQFVFPIDCLLQATEVHL